MAGDSSPSEKLLFELLQSPEKIFSYKKWIGNYKLTSDSAALVQDGEIFVSQVDFISYFLNFLREKASNVKTVLQSRLNEEKPLKQVARTFNQVEGTEYSVNFPDLQEAACKKNRRRINPTRISHEQNEDRKKKSESSKNVDLLISPGQQERFMNRFSSKKDKSSKTACKFTPIQIQVTSPTVKENFDEEHASKLSALAELYSHLIKHSLVPNISNELQFLLHIFSSICDHIQIQVTGENEFINILSSINDWKMFCIEAFLRLETICIKMDYIVKNFLHSKILESKMNINSTKKSCFLEKLKRNIHIAPKVCINFSYLNDCRPEIQPEVRAYEIEKKKFLDVEEAWKTNKSKMQLYNSLEYLLEYNNILILNAFGKLFTDCLIASLVESLTRKANDADKKNKLTTRISMQTDLEDQIFSSNEIFYKLIIEFCSKNNVKCLLYIKFWIFHYIKILSTQHSRDYGTAISVESRNEIISNLRVKISLAKFLGYMIFSFDKIGDDISMSEQQVIETIHGEFMPPIDIKDFLFRAYKDGNLTDTIPWIVQYLSMSDKRIATLPYYKDILFALMSLHVTTGFFSDDKSTKNDPLLRINVVLPNLGINKDFTSNLEAINVTIKESSLLLIKLWTGKLFDTKFLGEEIFFKIFNDYLEMQNAIKFNKGHNPQQKSLDNTSIINDEAFKILCCHFSKIKFWESSHSLTRNIRPSKISPTIETSDVDIQVLLEEEFLKDHHSMSSIIEFVCSKVFDVFVNGYIEQFGMEEENNTVINDDKSIDRIKSLIKDSHSRVIDCIKALVPYSTNPSVHEVTLSICLKRLNREIKCWLVLRSYDAVLVEQWTSVENLNFISEPQHDETPSESQIPNSESEGLPHDDYKGSNRSSLLLKRISSMMRELTQRKEVNQDVDALLGDILLISNDPSYNKEQTSLEELYLLTWNYTLLLVTSHPHLLTKDFLKQISLFWKENNYGDCQTRILNQRLIKAAVMTTKQNQKLIAEKVAQLLFWVLERSIYCFEDLEGACVALMQYTWITDELDFILLVFSAIKDAISDLNVGGLPIVLMNTIDAISETIIDIKLIE